MTSMKAITEVLNYCNQGATLCGSSDGRMEREIKPSYDINYRFFWLISFTRA